MNLKTTERLGHVEGIIKQKFIFLAKKQWWGDHRIDYVLYAPEKIGNLPRKSLPYIFHSCFWESTDAVAFILRMITKTEVFQPNAPQMTVFKNIKEPVEKWQRRLNRVKLRVITKYHLLIKKIQIILKKFGANVF